MMSKTESKLHGLTWAPARRFVVVVSYELQDVNEPGLWSEGWPVAAFDAAGAPIVDDGRGLATVAELLTRYTAENSGCENVSWGVDSYGNHPIGVLHGVAGPNLGNRESVS
jgi:hypothetical protein